MSEAKFNWRRVDQLLLEAQTLRRDRLHSLEMNIERLKEDIPHNECVLRRALRMDDGPHKRNRVADVTGLIENQKGNLERFKGNVAEVNEQLAAIATKIDRLRKGLPEEEETSAPESVALVDGESEPVAVEVAIPVGAGSNSDPFADH